MAVSRKERSLRILGKHLSVVQKEKRQLEERLREAQDELQNTTKYEFILTNHSLRCSHVTARLHHRLMCAFLFTGSPSGTESIMGDPGVAACQSLLSSVALLSQTFSSRADWLEQEVSAHQSHVTALRSELQDACLRHNQVFAPVRNDTHVTLLSPLSKAKRFDWLRILLFPPLSPGLGRIRTRITETLQNPVTVTDKSASMNPTVT
uniref:Coiled-coil domain containing 171 n=1 Tax=Periophthalmus magnuspinnatus TaxID=409849 RepID=A0A3B4BB16_9GOBI